MCLDTLDEKKVSHNHGYKIVRDNGKGSFETIHYKEILKLKESYISNNVTIGTSDRNKFYDSGFHYYLNYSDTVKILSYFSNDAVIIRLSVKNIVATGKQGGTSVGVSKFITVDRVMKRKIKIKPIKSNFEKYIKLIYKDTFCKFILDQTQDYDDIKYNDLLEYLHNDYLSFKKFMLFVDCLPRYSIQFKQCVKFWYWCMKEKPEKSLPMYNKAMKDYKQRILSIDEDIKFKNLISKIS